MTEVEGVIRFCPGQAKKTRETDPGGAETGIPAPPLFLSRPQARFAAGTPAPSKRPSLPPPVRPALTVITKKTGICRAVPVFKVAALPPHAVSSAPQSAGAPGRRTGASRPAGMLRPVHGSIRFSAGKSKDMLVWASIHDF